MTHHPLLVITTVPWSPILHGSDYPAAAREAWDVLFQHISAPENQDAFPKPVTLSVGKRFPRDPSRPKGWPFSSHQLWSSEDNVRGEMADAPPHLLEGSSKDTEYLLKIALQLHEIRNPHYPAMLLEPDGTFTHEFYTGAEDIFGEECPGETSSRYFPNFPKSPQ